MFLSLQFVGWIFVQEKCFFFFSYLQSLRNSPLPLDFIKIRVYDLAIIAMYLFKNLECHLLKPEDLKFI